MKRLNLGQLIDVLTRQQQLQGGEAIDVKFDFGGCVPYCLASYRGFYEDLSIGFSDDKRAPSLSEFIKQLEHAVGAKYQGYKGGTFEMNRSSRLWVANLSNTSDTVIVGVTVCDFWIVLRTEFETYSGEVVT